MTHEDAAPLAVLGGVLRNGYLHTAIREQGGAYGAGATQDSGLACFKFYSYRDPRVEETFREFRNSIDWVLERKDGDELVEQAILGIIGGMDRPGSPAGEAKQAYHMDKTGRTYALRQEYRQRLLATRWADVQRVAKQYLQGQDGSMAVVAPRGTDAMAAKTRLDRNRLLSSLIQQINPNDTAGFNAGLFISDRHKYRHGMKRLNHLALPPTSRGLLIGCLIGFVFTLAAQAEPQNPATSLQAATTDANTSLSIIKATDRNGQQSQARIEKLDDATLSRLADTRRALGEVAQLRLYNQQMALIVANQQEELAGYDSQIAAIDQTEQGILPLMVRMIDDLQRNTEQGLPFSLDERQSRIALLRDMLQRADVSVSEKYRRVLEAFQIELEYGRTLEAYRERVDGQAYDMLRVGRIGLYRLSQDQQQAWTWLMSSNGWRELPSDMLADIKQAFKVARQTTAPQLITVPLASPLVQSEVENANKEGGDV